MYIIPWTGGRGQWYHVCVGRPIRDARTQVINGIRFRKVDLDGPLGDLGTVSPDG
ncbi:hypothetical protein [Acidaminococcus timonensis]|uniref:hypothetical protein n=1 Tax=Acidaminococcus timonensis TaxID=1871002 RepID=UPI0013565BF8|nr:hypothetical protein [Acidaminococcus timonensis]